MMCYENSEEEKYEKGEEENKQESKNPDDEERKVDPGTARNTEEPQGTPRNPTDAVMCQRSFYDWNHK